MPLIAVPRTVRTLTALVLVALIGASLTACVPARSESSDGPVRVVTTTGILADIVRNVAQDRARVSAIVPEGADPHSYEPTMRDVRDVVYADAAFSNYLMLEEQRMIKMLDANLKPSAPNIALAEESAKYAAELIPLVEHAALDAPWLGLRVIGEGRDFGATRSSTVMLRATAVRGPGNLYAYLTGSFGQIERYFDSSNGFNAADGYRDDTALLPPDAHTHLSWAFTKPGYYSLDVTALLQVADGERPREVARGTLHFAVGVPASAHPEVRDAELVGVGHSDLAVDLDARAFVLRVDDEHRDPSKRQTRTLDLAHSAVAVPPKVLTPVPGDPSLRFLGTPGDMVYVLPQAVLGKHVHGEIDPHLWHNVRNVMAYAKAVRDTLIKIDPAGAVDYRRNTADYLTRLEAVDAYVRAQLEQIPPDRRTLITTHDAFGYLADAYGLTIAGFVTPNPGVEPSLADRQKLGQTLRTLRVPAVFLEPNLVEHARELREIAAEQGVQICELHGDTLTPKAPTYEAMMRVNADSLRECLGAA